MVEVCPSVREIKAPRPWVTNPIIFGDIKCVNVAGSVYDVKRHQVKPMANNSSNSRLFHYCILNHIQYINNHPIRTNTGWPILVQQKESY